MKPFLPVFLCLCGSLFAEVRAEISPEARACFEWFETLGCPDLKTAEWVVAVAESPLTKKRTEVQAFLLKEDAGTLTILPLDLSPRVLLRSGPLRWEKAFFPASTLAEEARTSPTEPFAISEARPDFRMGTAARTFLLAYACWVKGHPEEAQRLFDTAKKLPSFFREQTEAGDFRQVIEAELAHAATWEAVLDFGEAEDLWDGQNPESVSRAELLRKFQELEKRFPANPHAKLVRDTLEKLGPMVDEDRRHPPLTREQIARLPTDDQVAEWIFQLRDQNGRQISQPGSCDVFGSDLGDSSPAHRLAEIGFPAVPQLLAVVDEERPSRSVTFSRRQFFSHRPLTVGECAQQVLNRIARRSFPSWGVRHDPEERLRHTAKYREEVTAWWNEVKEKGETASLVEFVSLGQGYSVDAIERLKRLDPAACEAAVLAGARASGGEMWYQEVVSRLKTPASQACLKELMRSAPELSARVRAGQHLWRQGDAEVLSSMIREWKNTSGRSAGTHDLAKFLVSTNEPAALEALADDWKKRSLASHAEILDAFRENLSTSERPLPSWRTSPEIQTASLRTAHTLLASALQESGRASGFQYWEYSRDLGAADFNNPRLQDYAVFVLKRCYPKSITWTSGADETARESERQKALKILAGLR